MYVMDDPRGQREPFHGVLFYSRPRGAGSRYERLDADCVRRRYYAVGANMLGATDTFKSMIDGTTGGIPLPVETMRWVCA